MRASLTRRGNGVRSPLLPQRYCLLAALAFFVLMVAIGAVPGKAQEISSLMYDKLLHFIAYAFLSLLLYAGLRGHPAIRALHTLLAAAALGGLDEAIQSLVTYRDASWADWQTDVIASMSCIAVLSFLAARTPHEPGSRRAAPPDEPSSLS